VAVVFIERIKRYLYQMHKVLFFHGGPGLNGNPERHLLTDLYKNAGFDLQCWDEPSLLRPENHPFNEEDAFVNYLQSAELFLSENYTDQPLILIIYCFSSHLLDHLLRRHSDKIRLTVLVTPDFCLAASDNNIFSFVEKDFRDHHDARADQLLEIIKNYHEPFDENTASGWRLAVENPRLFTYYWQDIEQMQKYLKHYEGQYGLDPLSFFSVRKAWREVEPTPSAVPLLVLYGKYDRIVSVNRELGFIPQYFHNIKSIELTQSSHYPHIEEAGKVIELIKSALA